MVAFGAGEPSAGDSNRNESKNGSQPLGTSTPKKQVNGFVNGSSSHASGSTKPNGINGAGSSSKKRKIAYMDEEQDYGGNLEVNGRDTSAEPKAQKYRDLQEQRRQLPIAKGAPITVSISVVYF